MAHLTLPSPAKLNRFLHIVGRRADGYHLLQTAFQFTDLCDEIHFSLLSANTIELARDLEGVPYEENLIVKAAQLLKRATNSPEGVAISVDKKLPLGSGLGGGSSNAATTLIGLNALWKLNLPISTLMKLGSQLGADVPVFVYGHAALGEGIGDELTAIELDEPWCLILVPQCQISTPKLYADPQLTRNTPRLTMEALRLRGDCEQQSSLLKNDFEPVARARYPQVAEALDWLDQFGGARLSGSGSSVFALFEREEQARAVAEQVPEHMTGWIVKTKTISPLAKKAITDKIADYKWGVAKW
ncbi:MAG: 4-(cytidine 5'-diphospho)-2-C-methyl-D-erythritol kinase [Gammaproteobacteria bacterium]